MRIEQKMLEGRAHFVCPVVMLREGVFEGSAGAMYYPADEIEAAAHLWNGRPVVVYHPAMQTASYAGRPEVFDRQRDGTLFNARLENGRLKADAWIDAERVAAVDRRVLDSIETGRMMELSTGLYTDQDVHPGSFAGLDYAAIARNHRPDHLALLPDLIGACSIEDGAGFLRLNAAAAQPVEEPGLALPAMGF